LRLSPPGRGGATALLAAFQPNIVNLSWRYLFVILVSCLLMLAWALVINNVGAWSFDRLKGPGLIARTGRRRWPVYWYSPQPCFVRPEAEATKMEAAAQEEGRVAVLQFPVEPPGHWEPGELNELEERGRNLRRRAGN
jgi:hypothetical protein